MQSKGFVTLRMFQNCTRILRSCFRISSRYLRVLWFILILIYYSARKYWLQTYFKENIEANWASSFKIRAKIKKRAILGASHLADEFACLCRAICFSKVRLNLAFSCQNLVFFCWNLAWNSFYTVENPNLLVGRLNFLPIDQSFSSVLWSKG